MEKNQFLITKVFTVPYYEELKKKIEDETNAS